MGEDICVKEQTSVGLRREEKRCVRGRRNIKEGRSANGLREKKYDKG